MATIRITNLRLRTIIGANDWERDHKQDVVINVKIKFDPTAPIQSDELKDTIDYKTITKKIIEQVEGSNFYLIEKLADMIMKIVMENPDVKKAKVRLDKPHALRFADSVSIELKQSRHEK